MEATNFVYLISSLGFPIACVIALGWFAWYMVKHTNEVNAANMSQLQANCKEREDKLYKEIKENREINAQFAMIISKYETKLDSIQKDVSEIKGDMIAIKNNK